ncbi:MAG TPA: hypothetical protein VEL71_02290 [Candidatus Dormibacteraeota bacterium]|nr:hypothetical protein [Candidatus Dormibacteraeota bacterium]
MRQRSTRMRFKLGRTQSMLLHDEGEYSPSMAFRRKYAYGRTIRRYMQRNPSATLKQVNPLIRVLDPSVRIMSKDIPHGLGVLILRAVEFAGAGIGLLTGEPNISKGTLQTNNSQRFEAMSKSAIGWATQHSWDNAAKAFDQVIESVIS